MHYFKQISLSSFKRLLGQSLWVSAALLSSATLCHAGQATQTASPPDETEKTWTEVALELPPAPKPENLVFFYKGSNLSFAIDKPSVSVASDGTVRYTLVASNNSGAKNISYEAIRCETYEHKLYAFGRADGATNGTGSPILVSINSTIFYLRSFFAMERPLQAKHPI